jgi:hypothetical protein
MPAQKFGNTIYYLKCFIKKVALLFIAADSLVAFLSLINGYTSAK